MQFIRLILLIAIMQIVRTPILAQPFIAVIQEDNVGSIAADTIKQEPTVSANDSLFVNIPAITDSLVQNADSLLNSTPITNKKARRELSRKQFIPDPKRALWLSLIIPGAGQIYNRKYWKLPIIYGGFLGCTYALLWNQQMYKDYSQAYIDIMDDNPNTASYMKMLPMGYDITGREEQFKTVFKHKKDYYRRYRDLSIFAFFGVYLISVVDAYVDAQLSSFDISKDLSMRFRPTIIEQNRSLPKTRAVGLQCSLNF